MQKDNIKKIGVIGAGQMGSGIAQVAVTKGYQGILIDSFPNSLARAQKTIASSLEKLASKEKLDGQTVAEVQERLTFADKFEALTECDLIIEAVPEDTAIKTKVLTEAENVVTDGTILASNTSSISITLLGSHLKNPANFIGMHFMNPVPLMKLVEIIPGLATEQNVTDSIKELTANLGKTATYSKDFPGFTVNRILMPMINEAFFALQEGIASPEDIDTGMKLGTNQPMGPLQLADFIGLDTCHAIIKVLHDGLGDPKYRPCPLLNKYVEAGYFGRKSGRGVYTY